MTRVSEVLRHLQPGQSLDSAMRDELGFRLAFHPDVVVDAPALGSDQARVNELLSRDSQITWESSDSGVVTYRIETTLAVFTLHPNDRLERRSKCGATP